MENNTKPENKKSGIKKIVVLLLLLASIAGIIIFELFYFGVLGYEPQYADLTYDQLGSAKKLEGRTAMVVTFATDKTGKWDFSQEECVKRRRDFLNYTRIAADWLTEQGKKYGKEVEFCYPADENDELLYYEHDFGDIGLYDTINTKQIDSYAPEEFDYIENNIDSEQIKEKLGCENIAYYFYLNYDETNEMSSMMLMVCLEPNQKPYEIVWSPYQTRNKFRDPIAIAHETLHLFGAPDLYSPSRGSNTYNISEEFVDYCAKHKRTDIMFITGGIKDRTRLFDRIEAEITNITAYYIGWLEKAPSEIDWYRMRRSQFDKKEK